MELKHTVLAPHNLPYRMRLLSQFMGREFQTVLTQHQLTPLHWGVLSCLWREDGQPIKVIADQLEQLAGTLTVGLQAMEKRSLIHTKKDATDGRVWRVWLLPKGKKLQARLVPQVEQFVQEVFSCLSSSEFSTLARLTEKLHRHLEQRSTTT